MARVSINQLAKYLDSTPSQRRKIVRDAKNPPAYRVNWYDGARPSIVEFMVGGMSDETILLRAIQRLSAIQPGSDHEESKLRSNIEALEAVIESYADIDFLSLTPSAGPPAPPHLSFSNVDISVRPELLLAGTIRNQPTTGGVKIYLSKTDPLTDEVAAYIGCVVQSHVQQHSTPAGNQVRNTACIVYDVFQERVYSAPSATARRLSDIDAACQEIVLIWPTV
jgi:hypothetical protein